MKSTGKSTKTTSRSAAAPGKRTPAPRQAAAPRSAATRRTAAAPRRNGSAPRPRREEIALRAYLLFERSGRQHGRDLDHWLEAEGELTKVK